MLEPRVGIKPTCFGFVGLTCLSSRGIFVVIAVVVTTVNYKLEVLVGTAPTSTGLQAVALLSGSRTSIYWCLLRIQTLPLLSKLLVDTVLVLWTILPRSPNRYAPLHLTNILAIYTGLEPVLSGRQPDAFPDC